MRAWTEDDSALTVAGVSLGFRGGALDKDQRNPQDSPITFGDGQTKGKN